MAHGKSCLKRLSLKVLLRYPTCCKNLVESKVGADETKALNFTVAKADSSISGSVVDASGNPVSDLDLFIYVRNNAEGAGNFDILNKRPTRAESSPSTLVTVTMPPEYGCPKAAATVHKARSHSAFLQVVSPMEAELLA